jgi:hypothetical protein
MNHDALYNRLIIGIANVTLMTHAMSHRAKWITPSTIVELRIFLNRLVVDPLHQERAHRSKDDTNGNGARRGSGKRL